MLKTTRNGFSLIELLIAVSLILIIASIVMVALGESREKSRNTARVAQIREFQKAFNVVYSDTGFYPRLNNTTASSRLCLVEFSDQGGCYTNNDFPNWRNRQPIANAFVPQYLAQLPPGEARTFGQNGLRGIGYEYFNYGKSYRIYYFMEGNNRSCLIDGAVGSNNGRDTLCTLNVTP